MIILQCFIYIANSVLLFIGATHCLAEPKKLPNQKLDFEALAKQRVAVVGPVYLNEFLVNDPPPNVGDYVIEEYKKLWEEFRQN